MDEDRLDELFDAALERLQRGEDPGPLELSDSHAVAPEVAEEALQLARLLCPARPWGPPVVPGYRVLGELGRGGMGIVWLALQERAGGRRVALKTVPSGLLLGSGARERLLREARALSATRHPNVVVLHETAETEAVLAFAMEWVEGPTLAQAIAARARGSSPEGLERVPALERSWEGWVCRAGIQLARALQHLHQHGILHRDVKPSNVLLRRDGTPVLSDLGLAMLKDATVHTQSGAFLGTPAFAPPEQLRGAHADVDERSDVYSLGATLYHALALRPPVAAVTALQALEWIERRGPMPRAEFPAHLSGELCAILAKAMDPEPGRRYASADALADDLERMLDLRPVRARPATRAYRLSRFLHRNRGAAWASLGGGALAAVAASALVVWAVVRPRYVEARAREARELLLNSTYVEHDIVARMRAEGDEETAPSLPLVDDPKVLERYRRAMALYGSALRWSADPELRMERDAVRTALRLLLAEPGSAGLGEAPLIARFASGWARDRWDPVLDEPAIRAAPLAERRATGLLAYLVGAAADCDRLWRDLPGKVGDDPFIDGAFGAVLQHLGRAERAYPRLVSAHAAFSGHGYLLVQIADAALLVGDLEQAERFLKEAEGKGGDPFEHGRLVQADLAALQGDWVKASNGHREATRRHKSSRSRLHGAVAAFLAGDEELGVMQANQLADLPSRAPEQMAQAAWLLRRWWQSLDPVERVEQVMASWDESPHWRFGLLGAAETARLDRRHLRPGEAEQLAPADPWFLPQAFGEDWVARLRDALPPAPAAARAAPPLEALRLTQVLLARQPAPPPPAPAHRAAACLLFALDHLLWCLLGPAPLDTGGHCPLLAGSIHVRKDSQDSPIQGHWPPLTNKWSE